jgi:transposase-like protein
LEEYWVRKSETQKSRRKTPWDGENNLTPTQAFLKENYDERYNVNHCTVEESDEAEMVNSYAPVKCPFCGSEKFKKNGYTDSGVPRYKCTCDKAFFFFFGTIFDEHKLSISEWMEYCLNLFRHVSITADSWNNKNAFTTSRYWLQKLFLTLDGVQSNIVLSGTVWLDETFYRVRSEDVEHNEDGSKLRGISKNQIIIGVATDKQNTVFLVECTGKPSQKKTYETFRSHIKPTSTLIHDKESAHKKLVKELALNSITYASKDLKMLLDKDNPLYPVNRAHAILKMFLNAHSGFMRDDIQGYLNLFSLVTNPPDEMLEKVELVIKRAFSNPKTLRYRDFYGLNTGF